MTDWAKELKVISKSGKPAPPKRSFDSTVDRWIVSIFPAINSLYNVIKSELSTYFEKLDWRVLLETNGTQKIITPHLTLMDRTKLTTHLVKPDVDQIIIAQFNFKNYLKNGAKSFDLGLSVAFKFSEYSYFVADSISAKGINAQGRNNFLLSKPIDENLNSTEIERIISYVGEEALRIIKNQLNK